MGRHDLQNEGEPEKNPASPPADCRKKVSGLPDSDQCVGGRAGAAEAGSETAALSALGENRKDEDDAVDDQQCQKKRVKH